MELGLATPVAALAGLAGAAALAALALGEARSRRTARAVGLRPGAPAGVAAAGLALAATAGLLGLAAAQPTVVVESQVVARTDAQALMVFDISRSMDARRTPSAPSRLDRARAAAGRIRAELPDVPVGIASLTDRVLPHLFPTPRHESFAATVARAVAIDRPPPLRRPVSGRATALSALSALATQNYFPPRARRRVVVVLTDGESAPVAAEPLAQTLRAARVRAVFVRFWARDERVFRAGRPDPAYAPDERSVAELGALAAALDAPLLAERDAAAAADAVRAAIGDGPAAATGLDLRERNLAPYAAAAALIPLLGLIWSRNLSAALARVGRARRGRYRRAGSPSRSPA